MRKLLTIITILSIIFTGSICLAEEQEANQESNIQGSGGVVQIQKQPMTSKSNQAISVTKSFLCVIIQVNGKVKESDTNNK